MKLSTQPRKKLDKRVLLLWATKTLSFKLVVLVGDGSSVVVVIVVIIIVVIIIVVVVVVVIVVVVGYVDGHN